MNYKTFKRSWKRSLKPANKHLRNSRSTKHLIKKGSSTTNYTTFKRQFKKSLKPSNKFLKNSQSTKHLIKK